MSSITSWKVYKCTSNSGKVTEVLVGYDPIKSTGIIEEVFSSEKGKINGYTLFGGHNNYFEGFQQLWIEYQAKNDINSITDMSANYS